MRDITELKDKFFEEISSGELCKLGKLSFCSKVPCHCLLSAELKAYFYTILPKGYKKVSIFDLDGKSINGDKLINESIVLNAKNQISLYCWNVPFSNIKEAKIKGQNIDNISYIDQRRENGNCVIISGKAGTSPIGKTFIASIIMREAIKRRFYSSKNCLQKYDWIDFASLKNMIMKKVEDIELSYYRSCDWLVIDDIDDGNVNASREGQSYVSTSLDPFFAYRQKKNLPTIMVFRFDLKMLGIAVDKIFGLSIAKMLHDKNNIFIELTK